MLTDMLPYIDRPFAREPDTYRLSLRFGRRGDLRPCNWDMNVLERSRGRLSFTPAVEGQAADRYGLLAPRF